MSAKNLKRWLKQPLIKSSTPVAVRRKKHVSVLNARVITQLEKVEVGSRLNPLHADAGKIKMIGAAKMP